MNRRVAFAGLALVLVLGALTSCSDEPGRALPPTTKAYDATRCWFDAPKGVDVRCGYVSVPESKGSASTITIAVARFLAPGPSATIPADPVVFLTGGPGQDSATIGAQAYAGLRAAAGRRDVVAIDQRGTGKSDPNLACPEFDDPAFPSEATALAACRERIVAGGHDPASFRTETVANDVEAVRIALGYGAWNLLGFSYGTRLALTLARDHPEGVRSMVLSSIVPLEADVLADVGANAQRSFERVFASCAADPACAAAYPGLEAIFRTAVADLDVEPGLVEVGPRTFRIRGSDVISLLHQVLYDSHAIAMIPSLMLDAEERDFTVYGRIIAALGAQDFSVGLYYSVQCADELPFSAAGIPDPDVDPFYGAVISSSDLPEVCATWNVPASPALENEPVASAIPTLAIAGGFDPVTPPAYADAALASLANATGVLVPNGSHAIGLSDACSEAMIAAFFESTSVDPATTACAANAFTLGFRSTRVDGGPPFVLGKLRAEQLDSLVAAMATMPTRRSRPR